MNKSSLVFEGRGRPGLGPEIDEEFWERRVESVDVKERLLEGVISLTLGLSFDFLWWGKRDALDAI